MSVRLLSAQDYVSLVGRYDTWMFDCDGVLWHDDRVIDGVVEVLEMLRREKKRVIFVTNSATKSRSTYKRKFDKLGIQAHMDEIYGSAYAAAIYLSTVIKLPKTKKAYVIGMRGLEEELREQGIAFLGGTDPTNNTLEPFILENFTLDPDVAAVVCGLDTSINYTKISMAFQYLSRNPLCHFIVTNEDSTFPTAEGLLPGAGAINASLRYALSRDPVCIGKPSTVMLDCINAKVNYDPKRTIMVGDRLDTDILFGQAGGIATLLVLTGITANSDITGPNPSTIVPDYVTASLADLRVVA